MKPLLQFIAEDCKETMAKHGSNVDSKYPTLFGIARYWADEMMKENAQLRAELAERDNDHRATEAQLSAIINAGCECTECFRRVDATAYVDKEHVLCDRCWAKLVQPQQEEQERQERLMKDMRASA
jgi:hypothetical protein